MYTLEGIKSDRKKSNYIIRKQISRRLSNCYRCPRKKFFDFTDYSFWPQEFKTVGIYCRLSIFVHCFTDDLANSKLVFIFVTVRPTVYLKMCHSKKGFALKIVQNFFFFKDYSELLCFCTLQTSETHVASPLRFYLRSMN